MIELIFKNAEHANPGSGFGFPAPYLLVVYGSVAWAEAEHIPPKQVQRRPD